MRSFDQIISRLRQKSSAPTFAVFGLIDMFMKNCRLPDLHQVYKRETIAISNTFVTKDYFRIELDR